MLLKNSYTKKNELLSPLDNLKNKLPPRIIPECMGILEIDDRCIGEYLEASERNYKPLDITE